MSSSILIGRGVNTRKNHQLSQHLPEFLWLIRNVTLDLPENETGDTMTPTEFLRTNVLAEESGSTLVNIFPNFRGSILSPPLKNPKKYPNHPSNSEFFKQLEIEIARIKAHIQPKKGFSGAVINGPLLVDLIHEYVIAINAPDAIPNLEVSWQNVTELHLSKSCDEQVMWYRAKMEEQTSASLPIEEGVMHSSAPNTLYGIHNVTMKKCLDHLDHEVKRLFLPAGSLKPENDKIRRKQENIQSEFEKRIIVYNDSQKVCRGELHTFVQRNYSKSDEYCRKVFNSKYSRMHDIGCISIDQLTDEYNKEAIGPAKSVVLNEEIKHIPGPPSDVKVESHSTALTIWWNRPTLHPESSKNYDIQVKKGDSEWKLVYFQKRILQHGMMAIVPELQPNTEYNFRIRGKNESRRGEYSVCIVSKTKPGRPNKPPKPELKQESAEEAIITFFPLKQGDENGSAVTTIILESDFVCNSTSCEWKKTHEIKPKQFPQHHIMILESHREKGEYFFQVKYGNEAGYSEPSDIVKVQTRDLIPGKPITTDIVRHVTSLTFNWKPPDLHPKSVQIYELRVREKGRKGWTTYTTSELSMTVSSLHANTEYECQIQAKNCHNQGGSYESIVSTDASLPNQPKKPVLRVIDSEKIEVIIQRLEKVEENGRPVTHIKIEKSRNLQKWEHSISFEVDKKSDKKVKQTVEMCSITTNNDEVVWWYYRVSMMNEKGWSEPSEEAQLEESDLIPSAPRNLQVIKEECGSRAITLKWDSPLFHARTVEKYVVLVHFGEQLKHFDCVSSPYKIPNVVPNTTYTIQVKSLNGCKYGACSETIKHSTPFAPPNTPERDQIMVEVKSATDAELHVEVPQLQEGQKPVTHIIVEKFVQKEWKQETEAPVECGPGTVMDLTTKYFKYMRILLKSEAGISEPSAIVNVPSSSFIPGEPMNLRVKKCASTSVTLCWDKPQANAQTASKYSIEIRKETEGHWKTLYSVYEMEDEVTGLNPCSTIEFRICAQNDQNNCGEFCQSLKITTLPKTPDAPGIEMINYRSAKLAISKTDFHNDTSVNIETCEKEGQWTKLTALTFKDMEESVKTPLLCYCTVEFSGTPIQWRLQSFNECLKSEYSGVVKLKPDQFIPGAPTKLEVIEITSTSVTITWKKPKHPQSVAHYEIKVRPMLDFSKKSTYQCETNNEYTVDNLRMATKYLITVCALNKQCYKGECASIEAETMCPIPGPPTNVRLAGATQSQIKVRWGQPSENACAVSAYEVYFRKCGKNREFEIFATVQGEKRSAVKYELKPGRDYEFQVCSISKRGKQGGKAECRATTKKGTGYKVAVGSAAAVPTLGAGALVAYHAFKDDKDVDESP